MEKETSPLMRQYYQIKEQYADAILFFRLGDFYEMFDDDAVYVAKAIGITLTNRNGIPMCGVPYHSSENYLQKLLELGLKIAICEQLESPSATKGIVRREVVEVLSPASLTNLNLLKSDSGNYLVALALDGDTYSFAYIDLSTAEFVALSNKAILSDWFYNELAKLEPKEILLDETICSDKLLASLKPYNLLVTRYPKWLFDKESAYQNLLNHFKTNSLRQFNFDDNDSAIGAMGAVFHYLKHSTGKNLSHITTLKKKNLESGLLIDEKSRLNLEITQNSFNGTKELTLLNLLDRTNTPAGKRLLKEWLLHPLTSIDEINIRLDRIDFLQNNFNTFKELGRLLNKVQDIERLLSKLALDKAHAKDVLALKQSLQQMVSIKELLQDNFRVDQDDLARINMIATRLENAIKDDAPILLNEGSLINDGFDQQLDSFRLLARDGESILEQYASDERDRTKLNLRLKENRVIGYYFEVNKTVADSLPDYFVRRQSLTTGERYKTKELEDLEIKIVSAKENIVELERKLFLQIREELKLDILLFKKIAQESAIWDIAYALSSVALEFNYIRPQLSNNIGIDIEEGRHPVLESNMIGSSFVANSLNIADSKHFMLITGPNMAGKSTYLRQNALIVLMAQIGSFVSAKSAKIGVVDQIFCRLGSGDYLAKGESTFLVEMSETARILHNATPKSLVIMDEVGRGTGSDDGLALARAIMEYLANDVKSLTLFATHYHELTTIENKFIKNFHLAVVEEEDKIYFIKQLQEGAAAGSYGIHVAMLAKLPDIVINRASEYLELLLEKHGKPSLANKHVKLAEDPVKQVNNSLFSDEEILKTELLSFNISNSTPLDAMNFISNLQRKYNKK